MTDNEAKKIYQQTRNQANENDFKKMQREQQKQEQEQQRQKQSAKTDTRNAMQKADDEIKQKSDNKQMGGKHTAEKIGIKHQKEEDKKHNILRNISKISPSTQLMFNKGEVQEKELNVQISEAVAKGKAAEAMEQQKIDEARKPKMLEANKRSKQNVKKAIKTAQKSQAKIKQTDRKRALKVAQKSNQHQHQKGLSNVK